MTTLDIPRKEWVTFFDRLSRLHIGEPATVEVLRLDLGAQVEVADLPFDGISADLKDGECAITIAAGSSLDEHIAHVIADPIQVRVLCSLAEDEEAVEIRARDESVTLLRFGTSRGWSGQDRPS